MDLQKFIDDSLQAKRSEEMKTSDQLTLNELILKLESIEDKQKTIVFDGEEYHPSGFGCWRGSYTELAFRFHEIDSESVLSNVEEFISDLKDLIGKKFTGYKGGRYTMGKTTPLWVAEYRSSHGFKEFNSSMHYQGIVGISQTDERVIIETDAIKY